MKKYFLSLTAACCFSLLAHAQTEKGNVLLGSDLSNLSLNFQEGNTQFGLNINPKMGWFVADNRLLGVEVQFGLNTQKGATAINYGVGAFGRYYWGAATSNLARTTKWFAEANVGIYGTNVTGDAVVKTSTNGLGAGFGPGFSYFLTNNVALEALAKYNLTVGFGSSTTNNAINGSLGFQIFLPGRVVKRITGTP